MRTDCHVLRETVQLFSAMSEWLTHPLLLQTASPQKSIIKKHRRRLEMVKGTPMVLLISKGSR